MRKIYFFTILLLLLNACIKKEEAITPKPEGYFRIDIPKHTYQSMDTILPFKMEYSTLATLAIQNKDSGRYWIDIMYPQFNVNFKISYFPLHDNLRKMMVQEEKMVKFHYQKADDVEFSVVNDPQYRLFGQIYDIQGKEVATPLTFWLTDSTLHFVRASLYFNFTPNNDSLQPVIEFLREDALHMINTFGWK
ncbi:MAG: hypothetical protein RR034_00270 [Bacteroidales bacterium]